MALERSSHRLKMAGRDFAAAGVSIPTAIWCRGLSDHKAIILL
jgi:hypothetical protein